MAEYSRIAKGHVTNPATGSPIVINLPFQPDSVSFWNYSLANTTPTSQNVISGNWDVSMGQGYAVIEGYNTTPYLQYDTVTSNGITSFAAGIGNQLGPLVLLGTTGGAGIAQTSSTVLTVTTAAAHGLLPGNWILLQNLYQTATTGMQQIAGIPFEVLTVASTTTFTIGWVGNASNLTAITTAATGAAGFKQILYPVLYAPGVAFPWTITVSNGVGTVNTTAPHNFQIGQQIAFRIPSAYGAQQLNSLPDTLIPGQSLYYYVATVPTATSFTFTGAPAITAFNVALPAFTSFPGLKFAQVVAVGDINSGGYPYSGSALYPAPTLYTGNTLVQSSTINGPAIQGSFVNNTSQGFIIGAGAGTALTTATMNGVTGNIIYWRAYLSDLAVN
jgi:hypothetical protein